MSGENAEGEKRNAEGGRMRRAKTISPWKGTGMREISEISGNLTCYAVLNQQVVYPRGGQESQAIGRTEVGWRETEKSR